ncbi:MAG: DUF3618 domain-containing protein [Fulvimarina manganoxydans]|uniref:hypothetical protein n=1 Tax=Fulvimarina manganoxydans TaxID=937218 RepID=UPI002354DD86|nr:hypothetical protein [Fulvimarina manganoxydans]MCK5930944.1 DUF3618 domain-containing protein [Fulvimarina manganoxydans]
MSTETDRLEKEAEAHRSDLDATLNAIRGKLSLGQIVDELGQYVRNDQANQAARNLGRQVRDNPLALGVISAGFAWLFLGNGARAHGSDAVERYERQREDQRYDRFEEAFPGERQDRRSLRDRAHGAGVSLSEGARSVGDTLGRAGSSVSDAGHSAGDSVRRGLHDARDRADEGMRSAYAGARSTGRGMRRGGRAVTDFLNDEPFIAGALALGVGLAVASAFPSTRREDEWLGYARDDLRDRAERQGREALDKAGHVARRSFDAASEEAERQDLKPASGEGTKTLAERAGAVGRAAEEAAKDEASR